MCYKRGKVTLIMLLDQMPSAIEPRNIAAVQHTEQAELRSGINWESIYAVHC